MSSPCASSSSSIRGQNKLSAKENGYPSLSPYDIAVNEGALLPCVQFSVVDAYNQCIDEWMREAFRAWIQRNNWPLLITNGTDLAGHTLDEDKTKQMSETTTTTALN